MLIVKEYEIKSKTWGAMRNQDGIFLTEYVRSTNDYTDYKGDTWTAKKGVNYVIHDDLEIGESVRGRSSAGCHVKGDRQTYYMSIGNIVKMLQMVAQGKLSVENGKISGNFTFTKQGDTISLTPFDE